MPTRGSWNKSTYFRFLLPDVIPQSVDKILYLDSDTLCVNSIYDLWNTDINNYALAAAMDSNTAKNCFRLGYDYFRAIFGFGRYINSGMLLINLHYWRRKNSAQKIIEYMESNFKKLKSPDQDAINYMLRGKILIVSSKYNIIIPENTRVTSNTNIEFRSKKEYAKRLKDALKDPRILHYKPWKEKYDENLYKLWLLAKNRSPYRDFAIEHKRETYSKPKEALLEKMKNFRKTAKNINKALNKLLRRKYTFKFCIDELLDRFKE